MTYTGRKKYVSRRERKQILRRNAKAIWYAILVASVVVIIRWHREIFSYLRTYTY